MLATLYNICRFMPTQFGTMCRNMLVKALAKSCGQRVVIQPNVCIRGFDKLELGNDVSINDNSYINAMGGLKIGNGCRIAMNTVIMTESHNFNTKEKPIYKQGWSYAPIELKDDVWIGAGVVILKGITIGKGSIIGANSVVTKNIPNYEIWAGCPAKRIKKR